MQKWIYAQGRCVLVEVGYKIFISMNCLGELPEEESEGYHIYCNHCWLGKYSTEEKAEKVLEMIRVFLAKKGTFDEAVFEMPEDNEV